MQAGEIREVIFVGLPGPTHHYGGMAPGNMAATRNAGDFSHPREAALQVLALIRTLTELGQEVAVLPPQLRPHLGLLHEAGFAGNVESVITRAAREEPELLGKVYSSAAMWTANAATVTASCDSADGRLHITPANLVTHLHRSLEPEDTHAVLAHIFNDPLFACHRPLPAQADFADEGAANHLRLAPSHGRKGLNIFVYGRADEGARPRTHPARQSLLACRAIARRHNIPPAQALYLQQSPAAIDAGVFHNDVIAVANENLLLCHAEAYAEGLTDIARIRDAYGTLHPGEALHLCVVEARELSVEEAVATYFFNSQIITLPEGGMAVIAPQEVHENARAAALMERLVADPANPLRRVVYMNLRQSMKNGGGPACLRLRVPMAPAEREAMRAHSHVRVDERLLEQLHAWVEAHYRTQLRPADLTEPVLYGECHEALKSLQALLKLPLLMG